MEVETKTEVTKTGKGVEVGELLTGTGTVLEKTQTLA